MSDDIADAVEDVRRVVEQRAQGRSELAEGAYEAGRRASELPD